MRNFLAQTPKADDGGSKGKNMVAQGTANARLYGELLSENKELERMARDAPDEVTLLAQIPLRRK